MELYLKDFVCINNTELLKNGQKILSRERGDLQDYAKQIYTVLDLKYSKFYKMDALSKFGLLAVELLLSGKNVSSETSLIFANQSSSLDTDIKYNQSIQNQSEFYPSPSVFVYTLPNIVMGELSIKFKITGENTFFILPDFQAEVFEDLIRMQSELGKAQSFILTWLEILENEINVFSCYISSERGKNDLTLNAQNLKHLYKNNIMDEIVEKLKRDLIESLNLEDVSPDEIDVNAPLFGDGLGLDSIDALEIIVLLERNYGIKIKDQEAGKQAMKSLGTLAEFIKNNQ